MMVDAISFDLGTASSVTLKLASSEGLAPLPLPDAVSRFQAAMEGGNAVSCGDISRRGAESLRVVVEEKPVVVEREKETGLTGLTGLREWRPSAEVVQRPTAEVVQQPVTNVQQPVSESARVDANIQNPVNLVNPVKETDVSVVQRDVVAPSEVTAGGRNPRRDAESQRVAVEARPVVVEREEETGLTGLREGRPSAEVIQRPSDEVVQRPTAEVVQQPVTINQQPVSESARVDASVQNPVNLVNPVKETDVSVVQRDVVAPSEVTAEWRNSRRDAETQRVVVEEKPVVVEREEEAGLTGFTGLRGGRPSAEVVQQPVTNVQQPVSEGARVDANIQNPVNLVNPVKETDVSVVQRDVVAPSEVTAEGRNSRRDAETQRVVVEAKPVVVEREEETGLTGLTGLREERPSAGEIQRPMAEVVQRPMAEVVQQPVTNVQQPVSESARVDAGIQNPVNLVNPVKETDASVAQRIVEAPSEVTAEGRNSRRDAETQRVVVEAKPVVVEREEETGLTGLTGLREGRPSAEVVRRPSSEVVQQPVTNVQQPVSEGARVDAGIQNPVDLVNPVKETVDSRTSPIEVRPSTLVNPVKETVDSKTSPVEVRPSTLVNPVKKTVDSKDAPAVARSETRDTPEAPTALPAAPAPQAAAPVEPPQPSQVAAAQSARTEVIAETVGKTVEIVNQVVEAVVAEIAVTPTLAQGQGEIRIILKPTVLDGSEIHLSAKGGEMTVSVTPATAEAARIVQQNLPRLETALAEHAPSFHHVAVVVSSAKKGKTDETV